MSNRFLNKALELGRETVTGAKKVAKGVDTAWKEATPPQKLTIGMAATGLGVSGANFVNNRANVNANQQRNEIEQKSLHALQNIHKTLSTTPTHIDSL